MTLVKKKLLVCNRLKHEQMKIVNGIVKEKLLVCNRLKDGQTRMGEKRKYS